MGNEDIVHVYTHCHTGWDDKMRYNAKLDILCKHCVSLMQEDRRALITAESVYATLSEVRCSKDQHDSMSKVTNRIWCS